MMAAVSHNMRTPINTIKSMHSIIEMNIPAQQSKYLNAAITSTDSLLFLIQDMLDYFSLISETFQLKEENF